MKPSKAAFGKNLLVVASIAFFASLTACKGPDQNQVASDTAKVVTIANPGSHIALDSTKRYVYLTFDDAPQPPGTQICKDIFQKQNVKATFFIIGVNQFGSQRKKLVDSLRNSYPEILIANHSKTHGFKNNYKTFYQNADSAVQDFLQAEKTLDIPVKIIRLPGNNAWAVKGEMKGPKPVLPVCKKLDSLGYNVIGWDVEWRFKKGSIPIQSTDEMLEEVEHKFSNGVNNEPNTLVILAHDRMFAKPQYADSLNKFISTLKQDSRYVFETIDHYPSVQNN